MAWRVDAAQNLRGDMEIFEFIGQFEDSRFLCRGHIKGGTDRLISNSPIPANCLWGTGQWPHELGESVWLESLATMQWDLINQTADDIQASLMAHGRRFVNYDLPGLSREAIVQAFQQRRQHIYYLTWDRIELATGGITLQPLQDLDTEFLTMTVPGDGDFICLGVMDDSDGDYEIIMEGGRSGQRLMNTMMPRSLFAGVSSGAGVSVRRAASNPMRWRQPHLFNRQTRIHFRIRNLENATNVVRIVLYGIKSYAPELGKSPIELIGKGLVPRPLMTHGSGNWQALPPGAAGPNVMPPGPVGLYAAGWNTPG